MAPQISFPNIPAGLKIPMFWADWATAATPSTPDQRALIIAQTITAQPKVPVECVSVAQAVALFGAHSQAAQMVRAYRAADPLGELLVLPLADDGSAAAATGTISFTGTATAAGTLALYIAGQSVPVGVTLGMTAVQLATAVVAAITAWVDANGVGLPVSAAVDETHTYQVDLTAVNGGTAGNSIDVRLNYYGASNGEVTPAGITVAIVAMASGATDPSLTGLDAILGDDNYDFIVIPWSTAAALNAMDTLLANATGRWSWLRQDYGCAFAAKMDTDATGATNITFGQTRNGPHVCCVSYEPSPATPWEVAASFAAAGAVSTRADPARPWQTLTLPGLLAPPKTGRYIKSTQQSLLSAGMALMQYNPDGTCAILRAVSTYQKNAWGSPDLSYLDIETSYTLMAVIRTLKADVTAKFPRAKLVADGTSFGAGTSFTNGAPDASIVTPKSARAEIIASYARMMDDGWVQDMDAFTAGLVVQINGTDPSRLDVLFDPVLVTGLRIFAVLTQFFLLAPATGTA